MVLSIMMLQSKRAIHTIHTEEQEPDQRHDLNGEAHVEYIYGREVNVCTTRVVYRPAMDDW
jgi:hypothetical protein